LEILPHIPDLTQSAAALEHQTAQSPEIAASKLAAEVEQQVHHTESQISALETHAAGAGIDAISDPYQTLFSLTLIPLFAVPFFPHRQMSTGNSTV
jgi:hypothetical protein